MQVCTSEFGGPSDPTSGAHGYHGDLLTGRMAYAELGMGTLLGGLPYGQRARITYNGKSVVAEKLDIGAGGPGCGGFARGLDLWYETAKALGFSGLGVCTFETVDNSTPISAVGSAATASPADFQSVGIGSAIGNLDSAITHVLDANWWKRVGLGAAGVAVVGAGLYFALQKEAGGFKVAKQIVGNVG